MSLPPVVPADVRGVLEAQGLFTFEDLSASVTDEVDGYFERRGLAREEAQVIADLIYGSAAEVAVPMLFDGELAFPRVSAVRVADWAVEMALTKTDCSPTKLVHRRNLFEGTVAGAVDFPDAFLWVGDLTKILQLAPDEWVGANLPLNVLEHMETLVEELERVYQEGGTRIGRTLVEAGTIRLQGAVWKTKIAAVVDPENVESHLAQYLEYY